MKIVECPRDAMQGLPDFIPTEKKVQYINQLLKVGFDTLDMGSLVSAKAIPQMADTAAVISQLDIEGSHTKLLVIVANVRGAQEASTQPIHYIGFPLSLSETFQQSNTNKSITEALNVLADIKDICLATNKKLVTYLSMGFGNPYDDFYDTDLVLKFTDLLNSLGTDVISLADTLGLASPDAITSLLQRVTSAHPSIEVGAHLHAEDKDASAKIMAAIAGGATRLDGALMGFGGCPMANSALVGNIATEKIITILEDYNTPHQHIQREELTKALQMASEIFQK